MSNKIKNTSKILSLLLRHKPEEAGIILDNEGWADMEELIEKFGIKYYPVSKEFIQEVVETNEKKRFIFNEDATKIRASQGHSINVDLNLKSICPPEILYHGTPEKFVEAIQNEGLKKQSRQHVHLSADVETALNVGSRRGKPIVFEVMAEKMHHQGFLFFKSENGVWLTERVPVDFISQL